MTAWSPHRRCAPNVAPSAWATCALGAAAVSAPLPLPPPPPPPSRPEERLPAPRPRALLSWPLDGVWIPSQGSWGLTRRRAWGRCREEAEFGDVPRLVCLSGAGRMCVPGDELRAGHLLLPPGSLAPFWLRAHRLHPRPAACPASRLPAHTSASYSKPEPRNCHVYSSRELGTVRDVAWGILLVNSEALLVRRLGGWVLGGPAAWAGFRRPPACRTLVPQRAAVHVAGPGQPVHRAGWPGRGPPWQDVKTHL